MDSDATMEDVLYKEMEDILYENHQCYVLFRLLGLMTQA